MTVDLNQAQQTLPEWFKTKIPGASYIVVSELSSPGGGVSNETYFLTLEYKIDGLKKLEELVIRWPPSGFLVFPASSYDMALQYDLLKSLQATHIPTPAVFGLEKDPAVLGAPFFLMSKVNGWIPGDFPPYHKEGLLYDAPPEEQADVWWSGLDALIDIHNLDWETAGLTILGVPSGTGFMENQIELYDAVLAQNTDPVPEMLKRTRQWLLDNRFIPDRQTLCWGDARLGNMVFRGNNVAAILDWEMAAIGDPIADLAWFIHIDWAASEGKPIAPISRLPGLPDKAETIAKYESVTGRVVKNFDYYDALAAYRLAVVYTRIEQDERYLSRSGNKKGMLTTTHFDKLSGLIGP